MIKTPKNLNFDKTQNIKLWQNSKTKIGTKLKNCDNSNCYKTQKLKILKLKNSKFYNLKTQMLWNSKFDKTKNIKPQHNSKTQYVTKYKISNCDKA